jgi:hypothetical protein
MSGVALLMFVGVVLLPLAFFAWMGWWAVLGRDVHPSTRRPSLK